MTTPDDRAVSPPKVGIQSWAGLTDICEPCLTHAADIDEDVLLTSLTIASTLLYGLSGSRWPGICSDTVRPCARSLAVDYGRPIRPPYPFGGPYGYWPAAGLGNWQPSWGMCMCNRTQRSGCTTIPEIQLGASPIIEGSVVVTMDGSVVDPSTYRVDDGRWLVRLADITTTNNPGWPCCQRMDLPLTEKSTWGVAFNYGSLPDEGGIRAAATLGCQLALAASPKTVGSCRLPQRVQQITRQGVTAIVLDPWKFLDKGQVGLYEVDLWLENVNPGHLRRAAHVISPDIGRRVRRTGR